MWSTGQTSVCTGGSRNSWASSCWLMEGGSNLSVYMLTSVSLYPLISPRYVFFWWQLWLQDLWWFRSAALLAVSPSRCGLVCRGKSEESELGNRHHDGGYGHGNKMSEVNAKTLNGFFPSGWGGGLAVPTKSATFFLNKTGYSNRRCS